MSKEPEATRHITLRDARPEGEPDVEPSALETRRRQVAMKDSQRDLTSLSGPVPYAEDPESE